MIRMTTAILILTHTSVALAQPSALSNSQERTDISALRHSTLTKDLETFRDCPQCPEMVIVPSGGHFRMGEGGDDGELIHEVTIKESFAIGRREVTFAEWDLCVEAGACQTRPDDNGWGRDNLPVINVSWNDVQDYLLWLRAKTGHEYRLPSEAEWEFAARAGTTTTYPWGNSISRNNANYGETKCCAGAAEGKDKWMYTAPVGSFPPNEFGLYDTNGNVWEWTADCWHDSFDGAPVDGAPWNENCDQDRYVVRGGSWMNSPTNLRSTSRNGYRSSLSYSHLGFRIARAAE